MMRRRTMSAVLTLGIATAFSSAVSAATLNVPATFPTIQSAINAASIDDIVLVAPGTYNEAIDMLGKRIILRSSAGAESTIIDSSGLNTSTITFDGGADPPVTRSTRIDGFTITGGAGTLLGPRRSGGGILNIMGDPTIVNCIVSNNIAQNGAGVYNFIGDPKFVNCVFHNNFSNGFNFGGGGMWNEFSNPIIFNCTFSKNTADAGAALYNNSSSARLISCIIWDNDDESFGGNSAVIATHCDISGGQAGEGNIEINPMFEDPTGGDFRLQDGSPCIDAGDSTGVSDEYFVDADNNPRGVDVTTIPDTGEPVFGLTVDMGAYEFQTDSNCNNTCAGNLNDDNVVDVFDLLILLDAWGLCP